MKDVTYLKAVYIITKMRSVIWLNVL